LHTDPSGGTSKAPSSGIFGSELQTVLQRQDTEQCVPKIVRVLMSKLRANNDEGLRTEGIFRVPGDSTEMRETREALNNGVDLDTEIGKCDNVHSVAGLLKMFFRELPAPILTFELYDDLIRISSALGSPSPDTDVSELQATLHRLPPGHAQLLRHLMLFLARVASYTTESKMNVGNTAAVFAPNLLRPRVESIEQLADTVHIVNLVAFMIADPHRIFQAFPGGDDSATASLRQPSSRSSAIPTSTGDASPAGRDTSHYRLSASSADDTESVAGVPAQHAIAANSTDQTSASKLWYYLNDAHEQQGPVSWAELQAMFLDARLTSASYIFTEGMSNWTPASSFDIQ